MSFLVYLVIITELSWSQIIHMPDNFEFTPPKWTSMYLQPNELVPDRMKPALELAPSGVYLTVGTERAFLGAALAKKATHLLVIDLDPLVIRYNETTRALLIASYNTDELARLKFASRYSDWQEARDRLLERGYYKEAFHLGEAHFENYTSATLNRFPRLISDVYRRIFFPGHSNEHAIDSNYVLNENAFLHLKQMAEQGRMQFAIGNYGNIEFIKSVLESLSHQGLKISTFDMSNMYDSYLSRRILAELLYLVSLYSQKDSVLIGSLHMPFRSYFASNSWSQQTQDVSDGVKLANYLLQLSILESEMRYLGGNPEELAERQDKLRLLEREIGIEPFKFDMESVNFLNYSGFCQKYFSNKY